VLRRWRTSTPSAGRAARPWAAALPRRGSPGPPGRLCGGVSILRVAGGAAVARASDPATGRLQGTADPPSVPASRLAVGRGGPRGA
jgi:hypothetical protein